MNILTDDEIEEVVRNHGTGGWQTLKDMESFARAIEAAILAKLEQAEPVAWTRPDCPASFITNQRKIRNEYQADQMYSIALFTRPPLPAKEGWDAIHLKTGNVYRVIGDALDATNMTRGMHMVIYQRDGKTYVREASEFQAMLAAAPGAES